MLAIDSQIWVPIATTLIGGVIATGSVMLALIMGKSREIDQDHRRWVRQVRLDAYVSFLREEEALFKREGEVLNLVLAEAPEPEIEESKERLREEEKRMSAVQAEALLATSPRVESAIRDQCYGNRPMTIPLIFSNREQCDVDLLHEATETTIERRTRLLREMKMDLGLAY